MKALFFRISVLACILSLSNTALTQVSVNVAAFKKVEVFGKLHVRLEKSNYDSLFIQSGSFDINQIKFSVEDSVLKIKLLSEFPPEIKVEVKVNFQQLKSLAVAGGAKVYNKGGIETKYFNLSANSGCEVDLLVNIDSLSVKVAKGAFVRLTGQNNYLKLKTNTGGDFRSTKMTNSIMDANMKGGSAEVVCTDYLKAKLSFGATLKYVAVPKKIEKKERSKASVTKLQDY